MGKGRKIKHLLPSLFNYNRLPSASSESRPRPLPADDYETAERVKRDCHEIDACLKRNEELEKEVHKLRSDLLKLQSQLSSLSKLLPPKVDNEGQEESKEIKELKSRLTMLELEIHLDPLMKKQEENIKELQESSAATEKKITELMTKVVDLQKFHRDQTTKKLNKTDRLSTVEKKMAELAGQVAELKSRSLNSAVSRSYRPGYNQKLSVPRDWWTEDISILGIDLFRCIIIATRATNMLPPQLIGEALHVYASQWLRNATRIRSMESSASQSREMKERNRRTLENIVSMIPSGRGSVSFGFLLRLLSIGNFLGLSPATRTELIKRSSQQLDEATVKDLLFPSCSSAEESQYDIELVMAVVESYSVMWRRQPLGKDENNQSLRSIRKVAKVIDSYLQVISRDVNLPVPKVVAIAEALPDVARPEHDELYKAINTYLKEHPGLEKADKKRLCRILDCRKLSPEVRAHAVKNKLLPLRTVVQVLFFDQEKGPKESSAPQKLSPREILSKGKQNLEEDRSREGEDRAKPIPPGSSGNNKVHKMKVLAPEFERKLAIGEIEEVGSAKGKEAIERTRMRRERFVPSNKHTERGKSDHSSGKARDRIDP